MRNQTFKKNLDSGFTVAEALVVAALLGFVALAASKLMTGTFNGLFSIRMKGEGVELKEFIRNSLDCEKTVAASPNECKNGDYVSGLRSDKSVIFSKDYENMPIAQNFRVRSKCIESGGFYTFAVEYKRVSNGQTQIDPLTKKPFDWQPLFKNVPLTCAKPSRPMGPCLKVTDNYCPANHAVFAINDSFGPPRQPQQYNFDAQCCPVPYDMLLADHVEVTNYCGAGRVATGARLTSNVGYGTRFIRCTLVDATKYSVGAPVTTDFYEVPPNASGYRGATRQDIRSSPFPLPLKFNLFKQDNLASDPQYPGRLKPTDTSSPAFGSQCIVQGGNSIIIGRNDKYCGTAKGVAIKLRAQGSVVTFHPTGCTGTATNSQTLVTIKDLDCTNIPYFWQDALKTSSGH